VFDVVTVSVVVWVSVIVDVARLVELEVIVLVAVLAVDLVLVERAEVVVIVVEVVVVVVSVVAVGYSMTLLLRPSATQRLPLGSNDTAKGQLKPFAVVALIFVVKFI
jgi:hypothetical protein